MIQFDCHAHVYETVTAIDGARYIPARPAPLADWLSYQHANGLKGGVIVQVSFLGTDNSEMCAALAGLDRARFAGVGVVPLEVGDAELDRLMRAGMRGVRWNLVRGADLPDLSATLTRQFLTKLRARGLHLELHLEGPRLAPVLPALVDQGVNLVIDHFGLPSEPDPRNDPMIRTVADLPDRSALHFKFAAHYRTGFDLVPHATELLSQLSSDHIVWGSDWPHTQHESRVDYAEVCRRFGDWGDLSDGIAAKRLYGIG
ncbi:amidohydrolase family protein [Phaeobacter sp. J2-8]|uniref:amidohydrolase family protein n=1 Tax=Phaeobacter sp. J2-8 TaxID=2931394 RepID=UPI001FD06FB8|nr:amidohydrolase family protein [Phaeobacter sp. J2-8]MCJ7874607.1 amidohydrolase family protein [Phaeobacter sp. J2-8]